MFGKKPQNQTMKLLVVDDDPSINLLLGKFLQGKGYDVVTAWDGEEALAKAASEQPDLILLDNMMPKMDGPEVLEHLSQSEQTRNIPVIMVTGRSDKDFLDEAHKRGAAEYIVKPFDYEVLLDKITGVLGVVA